MSEELLQMAPKPLGRYLFYKLGNSTLRQLKHHGIIRGRFTKSISSKKPDGIVVLAGGDVKAIIEYKTPSELKTLSKIKKAILQEIEVAAQLCKLLIVTSGRKTIWMNALTGERVLSENGKELKYVFDARPIEDGSLSSEDEAALEQLVDKIDHSLTKSNNRISLPEVLDPSSLARAMWQKIWINTGKEPEKCLYNVVELFVFKFLSDVGVLKAHNNFNSVYSLVQSESPNEALKHYANICRKEIQELFPKGGDGTTIINGTIFVNESGEPNLAQSNLFREVLRHLQDYDSKFGSFKYIKKEFKTRLYESFLRQNAGIRFLGQYFTPRNVVKAMVHMSDAANLRRGARVCDPFCGVGGFLLELIAENEHILREFRPVNKAVSPCITVVGYDKGSDEKEDERTIILAKANMLIYLSDLLSKYHTKDYLKAFATGALNSVFNLLRSNLGTFSRIGDQPYDLILTNPPYVTSGIGSLRLAINEQGLSENYTLGGRGTESLAIEWVVNNLKEKGQALVIVPDGLVNQEAVLSFLKRHCIVESAVSLPIRTFYSTARKTYILGLRKKMSVDQEQITPVFTYLVGEIGETRDARRFSVPEKNDLIEMVSLFNQFKGSPESFKSHTIRCKVIEYEDFNRRTNWLVDRWWGTEEKAQLGISDTNAEMTEDECAIKITNVSELLSKFSTRDEADSQSNVAVKSVALDDDSLFEFIPRKTAWTKKLLLGLNTKNQLDTPVYTATTDAVAFVTVESDKLIACSKSAPLLSFASNGDGSAGRNFVIHDRPFYVSNDRTVLKIKSKHIVPEFLLYKLQSMREEFGFCFAYKAIPNNLGDVLVEIPVSCSGQFDRGKQLAIVGKHQKITELKKELVGLVDALTSSRIVFDS